MPTSSPAATVRPVRLGRYSVTVESETFRIFPRDSQGRTRPVTVVRNYINLQDLDGTIVVLKRFFHTKQWYWRDSRDAKPCSENHIRDEIARMCFPGRPDAAERATDVMVAAICGHDLSEIVLAA